MRKTGIMFTALSRQRSETPNRLISAGFCAWSALAKPKRLIASFVSALAACCWSADDRAIDHERRQILVNSQHVHEVNQSAVFALANRGRMDVVQAVPNLCGKITQGEPVRAILTTASINCESFVVLAPLSLALRGSSPRCLPIDVT